MNIDKIQEIVDEELECLFSVYSININKYKKGNLNYEINENNNTVWFCLQLTNIDTYVKFICSGYIKYDMILTSKLFVEN